MIISENCKLWILIFVENRIQQDHEKTLIDFINSSTDLLNDKIVKEFLIRRTTSLSSEIDISELFVVIKTGNLLMPWELKSVEHKYNTTGDQIGRICKIRNAIIHTGEPNLDERDYSDHINEVKDIGKRFEVINGEQNGTYTMQIEDIWEMESIVTRLKLYVEMVYYFSRQSTFLLNPQISDP